MNLKRQFLWGMTPLVVVSAVNLFSVPLFLRFLGEEMYALWFYLMVFSGLFGFADLGLGIAVTRYVGMALGRGDRAAVREYWGTGNLIALPLLMVVGAALAISGVFIGPQWFNAAPEHHPLLRALFVVGGVSLFLNYYGQFWIVLLQAHLDFQFTSLLRTACSLLQVIPAIWIAWRTGSPLWITIWAALVGLLQLGLLVWHARRHHQIGFDLRHASLARGREMAAYTGKTFVSLVVNSMLGSLDRLILGRLAPAAGFTLYSICSNVGMRLQGLGAAVMGPVFHNTNRAVGGGQEAATTAIFDEMFSFLTRWYLVAAAWVAVWHPVLLRLWLGAEDGARAAALFTPIILAYCLNSIAGVSSSQLSALNRVGTALGFTVTGALLAAAGAWIGWHAAGVVGVAWGFLASRVACVAQDLFAGRLVGARGWLSGWVWTAIGMHGLVGGAFALSYLAFKRDSAWLILPAGLHAAVLVAVLLRHRWQGLLGNFRGTGQANRAGAKGHAPES
ncbi:MAG: oligosaccharide flippase family protein [Verrucomicrobia bacterium]|nr:oligosaccharide flippase family protein [Verrucomicrobiota bacterium]